MNKVSIAIELNQRPCRLFSTAWHDYDCFWPRVRVDMPDGKQTSVGGCQRENNETTLTLPWFLLMVNGIMNFVAMTSFYNLYNDHYIAVTSLNNSEVEYDTTTSRLSRSRPGRRSTPYRNSTEWPVATCGPGSVRSVLQQNKVRD